jgi:hypothetical protein
MRGYIIPLLATAALTRASGMLSEKLWYELLSRISTKYLQLFLQIAKHQREQSPTGTVLTPKPLLHWPSYQLGTKSALSREPDGKQVTALEIRRLLAQSDTPRYVFKMVRLVYDTSME